MRRGTERQCVCVCVCVGGGVPKEDAATKRSNKAANERGNLILTTSQSRVELLWMIHVSFCALFN